MVDLIRELLPILWALLIVFLFWAYFGDEGHGP
jgi:hypothetical protein